MLRLTRGQRTMLADKLLDSANVAAGALVFGQFLADRFSIALLMAGLGLWSLLAVIALAFARGRGTVTGFFIVYGGIALFAGVILLLDTIARRHDRKTGRSQRAHR